MISYPWTCFACTATNPPETSACRHCGCPAAATFAQVESARRRLQRGEEVSATPSVTPITQADPFAHIATWPLLKISAAVCAGVGLVTAGVSSGSSGRAFGGLMLALAALCVSSMRSKPAVPPAAQPAGAGN